MSEIITCTENDKLRWELAAKIETLKETICHKDGAWSNCHTLKKRVANLQSQLDALNGNEK